MSETICATIIGSNQTQDLKFEPERICPLCHTSFDGTPISAFYLKTHTLYVTHHCHYCKHAFFSIYSRGSHSEIFFLKDSFPKEFKSGTFPKSIVEISPNFINIYNQALQAEINNLFEICGFGYRRALEFLIKDYLIHLIPDQKDKILTIPISTCINNYVDNPKLKAVAERAIWLGNDHSHYISKHTDKDLSDLKTLINVAVYWIAMEYETTLALTIQKK